METVTQKVIGNACIDDWIKLFNSKTEEDLNMIKSKNIGIQRAKQLLHEMSLTDAIRETIENTER